MKMSVQNTGQRRISMAAFAGLFLLAVALSCMAFVASFQSKGKVSEVKLKEFEEKVKAFEEKEKLMNELATLSRDLQEYDENPSEASLAGKFRRQLEILYQQIQDRDTTLYRNARLLLEMAESYKSSIDQRGVEANEQFRLLQKDLELLREKHGRQQLELMQKERDMLGLQNQIQQLQFQLQKKGSSGGGGGNDTLSKADCKVEVNNHKIAVIGVAKTMQENLQKIQAELDNINGVFGIGKHKKEKERIDGHIQALEQNITELTGK